MVLDKNGCLVRGAHSSAIVLWSPVACGNRGLHSGAPDAGGVVVPECAFEVECVLAIIVSTGANALRLIFRRDRLVGEYRLIALVHLFCGLLLLVAIVDCIREYPL